jgi:hypothetical protein
MSKFTELEIAEHNVRISKFMGNERKIISSRALDETEPDEHHYVRCDKEVWVDKHGCILDSEDDELYYHCDWNWIMPVVEKIRVEHRFSFDISNAASVTKRHIHQVDVFDDWLGGGVTIVCTAVQGISLIEVIYEGVVEFVKWYDSKKNVKDD